MKNPLNFRSDRDGLTLRWRAQAGVAQALLLAGFLVCLWAEAARAQDTKGLWIGQIIITNVNEVQKAINGASEETTPTRSTANLRVLLHVNALDQVRLLKDVTVMETPQDLGNTNSPKQMVLVTDPQRLSEFQGVATRFGKKAGLRYGSVSFDFPGHSLPLAGTVGPGGSCSGTISLPEDFPTNPFRHYYHPDHRTGFDLERAISFQFEGISGNPLARPGYGVDQLRGAYGETITGLHKIPLKISGVVALERVSLVDKLNNELP